MEEEIKVLKQLKGRWRDIGFGDKMCVCTCREQQAIENILNELKRLQDDNQEHKRILDIFDERTYRKKYLEEERAKRPRLLYPDADEIYRRYYELKTENENITRELLARTNKLNDLLEERKQLKDKMIGDKMEQFDDYIIYLIESYLDTMGDK